MAKIQITCDSTCDLTRALYETYHIRVVPLGVCLGEEFRHLRKSVCCHNL